VDGTAHTMTLDTALGTAPGSGVTVRPAPANWEAIRDAVLRVFDTLTPGDTDHAKSKRFPSTDVESDTLYQSTLVAAAQGIPGLPNAPAGVGGVKSVVVDLLGATDPTKVVAAPLTLITPGELRIVPGS